MGERTPAERIAAALEQGARIHPQSRSEFETGFSVAWHRVTWIKGSWAGFTTTGRTQLRKGEGRVYFAGDHVSNANAWMQGAFESAREAVMTIHERTARDKRTA
jgi:monoamine oxidase